MKVICIKGDRYGNGAVTCSITVGKVYDVIEQLDGRINFHDKPDMYYVIWFDNGSIAGFPIGQFKTLDEVREDKLNLLLS